MQITQEYAVKVANKIELAVTTVGAHCALGGSCLHSGGSNKDIDIYLYDHSDRRPSELDCISALMSIGMEIVKDFREFNDDGYADKRMVRFDYDGTTVEVFFFLKNQ